MLADPRLLTVGRHSGRTRKVQQIIGLDHRSVMVLTFAWGGGLSQLFHLDSSKQLSVFGRPSRALYLILQSQHLFAELCRLGPGLVPFSLPANLLQLEPITPVSPVVPLFNHLLNIRWVLLIHLLLVHGHPSISSFDRRKPF